MTVMVTSTRGCHVIVLAALLLGGCGGKKDEERQAPTSGEVTKPAAPPLELSILYGSEKKSWLEQQITAFNASGATTKDGRVIRVVGKATGSGEAMTGILDGTEKPVVFSPASSAYITLLNQKWQTRDNHTKALAPAGEPIVLSPGDAAGDAITRLAAELAARGRGLAGRKLGLSPR